MTTPSYLDTPQAVTAVDSQNLAAILRDIPGQFERASQEFGALSLPPNWRSLKEVVFCGMGGSAIGAQVACELPFELRRKPLAVVRDYSLPAHVGQDSLVVVVSYSGDTEEAVACFEQAVARQVQLLVVTSGGVLEAKAKAQGVLCYKFTYPTQPRDAFGFLFAPLLRVLVETGVLEPNEARLGPACEILASQISGLDVTSPTPSNLAKQLAFKLFDHVPLVVGTSLTLGVAQRWKNQCNEHSKVAAFYDALPELNHNTIEGFAQPARFKDDVVVVLLMTDFDHPEVALRMRLFKGFLDGQGVAVETLKGLGQDIWSQKLSLVALGDWTSYYLALLNRVDPAPVPMIAALKAKLRGLK